MATYDDLELEKLAELDKRGNRKANTLGADGSIIEEPFGVSKIVLRDDVFSETPTAETNFASPDYADYTSGGGSVATRHVEVRLHPLVTSGTNGNDSIQTFVAVYQAPASDSPEDIEEVRIKHLVPADLSLGRRTAAEVDTAFRGFELALYPARNNGGTLEADTTNGPIPITADPGAANGIGNTGRWTVDYASGIVRFTRAPLNGSSSIVNPNDVYGTLDGTTTTSAAGGRITMFATFYEYVAIDPDDTVIVVGDGTHSFGTFYGPTSAVMQSAVDSLATYGGTVFLKEGDYSYSDSVYIPANVNIIGLSKNATITKPDSGPAFVMFGSNSSVQGVTIKENINSLSVSGADIEIATTSETETVNGSKTVQDITIKDNILWASSDAYGIGFAPRDLNSTFSNIKIDKNIFKTWDGYEPTYIAECLDAGTVTLKNVTVDGNDFGSSPAKAFYINGTCVEEISELHIINNHSTGPNYIEIDANGIALEDVDIANNSEFEVLKINGLSGANISNNICSTVILDGYVSDSQFRNNIINDFELVEAANAFTFSENSCLGNVIFNGNQADQTGLLNVNISNNRIHKHLDISKNLTFMETTYVVDSLTISDNRINFELRFAANVNLGNSSTITYKNLKVQDNIIGDGETTDGYSNAIKLGDGYGGQTFYLDSVVLDGNNLYGDVNIYNNVNIRASDSFRIVNNTFNQSGRGIYFRTYHLNNLEISRNRVTNIVFFDDRLDVLSSNHTISDLKVDSNVILDNGSIDFKPEIESGLNTFELYGLQITRNIFEGSGNISVLTTSDNSRDYDLVELVINGNHLANGNILLGKIKLSDSTTDKMSLLDNYVNGTVFIGGSAEFENLNISGNTVTGAFGIAENVSKFGLSNNSLYDLEFGSNIFHGTISGNQILGAGFSARNLVNSVTISGNDVDGYFSVDGYFYDSVLSGNNINGATTLNDAYGSVISGNRYSGEFSVNVSVDHSQLVGNTFEDEVRFVASVSNTLFENNDAYGGNIYFDSRVTNSKVGNNYIGNNIRFSNVNIDNIVSENIIIGTMVMHGDVTRTPIHGNRFNSSFTLNASIDDSIISDNILSDTVTLGSTTSNDAYGTTISGNVSDSDLNIVARPHQLNIEGNKFVSLTMDNSSGTKYELRIINNQFGGAVHVVGSQMTNSKISNNTLLGQLNPKGDPADWQDVVLNGNSLRAGSRFNNLTNVTISDNIVDGYINIDGAISDSMFNDNRLDGYLNFNTTTDVTVSNNHLSNIVSFNGNSLRLDVLGNQFNGEVKFYSDLQYSNLSNNQLNASLTMEGSTVDNLNFSNNIVDIWFISSSNPKDLLKIEGNTFTNEVGLSGGNLTRSVLTNNKFVDSFVVAGSMDFVGASLSNNVFIGPIYFGRLDNVTFNNNVIETNIHFVGAIENSIIGENTIYQSSSDIKFYSTVDDTNISDNLFESDSIAFDNSVGNSVISGNKGNASIIFHGVVSGSNISDNNLLSDLAFGDLSDSTVCNNICSNLIVNGDALQSVISNSILSNGLTLGGPDTPSELILSNVSDNVVDGYFTSRMAIRGSGLSNNRIIGTSSFYGSVTGSELADNKFDGYLEFNSQIDKSPFIGNSVAGETYFHSDFRNSTMSGNTFYDDVEFGNTIDKVVISSNEFDGYGLALYFNAPVDDSSITSNRIGGGTDGYGVRFSKPTNNIVFSNNIVNLDTTFDGSITLGTVNGNNFIGMAFFNDITQTVIGGNVFSETVDFNGDITECTISGNKLDDDVLSGARLIRSTLDGNIVLGDATFVYYGMGPTTMSDSVISNNVFASALTLAYDSQSGAAGDSVMTDSVLSNNYVSNGLIIAQLHSLGNHACLRSVVRGNTCDSEITISSAHASHATLVDSLIDGNQCNGDLTVTHTDVDTNVCSKSSIINNIVNGTGDILIGPSLSGSGYALGDSTLSGNTTANGDLIIGNSGKATDSTSCTTAHIFNNMIEGDFIIYGKTYWSVISDNENQGNATFDNIEKTTVSGNTLGIDSSDVTFGGDLDDCTISANIFYTTLFTAAIDNTKITSNEFVGAVTLPAYTSTNLDFSDNRAGSTVTSASGNHTYTGFIISNNQFSDSVSIQCVLIDSMISANEFASNLNLDTSSSSGHVLDHSTLESNHIGGNLLISHDGAVASGITIQYSNIVSNIVDGTTDIEAAHADLENAMYRTNLNNNNFDGAVTITNTVLTSDYAVRACTISNNVFNAACTISHQDASGEGIINTAITGNRFVSTLTIAPDLTASNTAYAMENVSFNGNVVEGNFSVADSSRSTTENTYTDCTINNNVFTGSVTFNGPLGNMTLSGNSLASTFAFDGGANTVISNNTITGNTSSSGNLNQMTITGNDFRDHFDVSSYNITSSKISGNTFEQVSLESISSVIWNDNRHSAAFLIQEDTNSSVAVSESAISNNLFESTFVIQHASGALSGGTNQIEYSLINGNVFLSGLKLGYSTSDTHLWVSSSFSNNAGSGDWELNTSDHTNVSDMLVTGNNINGNFEVNMGTATHDWDIPHGADTNITALNFFTGYTNDVSITAGNMNWGSGASGVNL